MVTCWSSYYLQTGAHHLENTHTSQPLYLYELISHYRPSRSPRSSNANLLTRPPGITSNFSSRAFSVSAPSTWNSLPAHIRSIDTLSTFKRHLKFHLFQSAFTVQSSCASAPDLFSRFLALYKFVRMYVHALAVTLPVRYSARDISTRPECGK